MESDPLKRLIRIVLYDTILLNFHSFFFFWTQYWSLIFYMFDIFSTYGSEDHDISLIIQRQIYGEE